MSKVLSLFFEEELLKRLIDVPISEVLTVGFKILHYDPERHFLDSRVILITKDGGRVAIDRIVILPQQWPPTEPDAWEDLHHTLDSLWEYVISRFDYRRQIELPVERAHKLLCAWLTEDQKDQLQKDGTITHWGELATYVIRKKVTSNVSVYLHGDLEERLYCLVFGFGDHPKFDTMLAILLLLKTDEVQFFSRAKLIRVGDLFVD